MKHISVRSKVTRDDIFIAIECFDPYLSFDCKTATMLEVDQQNKLACAHLNDLGLNGDSFWIKARRQTANLVHRLLEQTREEELIIALAKSGINLSSIFVVAGPKCLSTDEKFKVIDYIKMFEAWDNSTKERKKLVDERTLHERARVAESKGTKTKP
jgi:hypothetical protein